MYCFRIRHYLRCFILELKVESLRIQSRKMFVFDRLLVKVEKMFKIDRRHLENKLNVR